MIWRVRYLYRFLARLVFWIPKLWRDQDYDSAYLYHMMAYKISRMRQSMIKADRHTAVPKNARDMSIAIELLNRMAGYDKYHDWVPYGWNCAACEKILDGSFNWENNCPDCRKTRDRWYKWLEAKEKADKAYLWKLLAKEADRWWD